MQLGFAPRLRLVWERHRTNLARHVRTRKSRVCLSTLAGHNRNRFPDEAWSTRRSLSRQRNKSAWPRPV